ncbi:MAG: PAS domain-containing sensor histidine kinase [Flavobacteriales bacterium]
MTHTRFTTEEVASIYGMLFSSAAEGLVVVDGQGLIRLFNPRLAAMFGYEPRALLDQPVETLIPEAVRSRHQQQRSIYQRDPHQRPMGNGLELNGQRRDGTTFAVEVSLNHFVVNDQRYVMGLVSDVTRRRHAERALQRTNMELEQRVEQRTADLKQAEQSVREALEAEKELNSLKSRFVSMASHEFRTPLSTIMSSVDLIARYAEGPQKDKVERHVAKIRGKVRELTTMLNDFLSLDKLEQGMVRCTPQEVDVVHLCIELVEELRSLCKPGQEIDFDHEGQERVVVQDKQMLAHILSNLLSNAIKYSPENELVILRTRLADGTLTIEVSDHGMGIPKEDQQHLFERFFRASNAFTVQGTGLGLNIVRKYLDLMAGHISFTSEPGKGTTFVATIPQHVAHEAHPADRG